MIDGVRVCAIIQARMGSTRLPGKVLQHIMGKPLLEHIILRLRKSRWLTNIVIATSVNSDDDAIVKFAKAKGVGVVRGATENVLERFALAVEKYNPDYIFRVCGDAPLLDVDWADHTIDILRKEKWDFCLAPDGIECIFQGCGVFSRAAFSYLLREGSSDPIAREHISAYLKLHPEGIRTGIIDIPQKAQFSARLSVDTPADIKFIETIYTELGVAVGEVNSYDLIALLQKKPELLALNAHIHQKCSNETGKKVIICCKTKENFANYLLLGQLLRDSYSVGIIFCIVDTTLTIMVEKNNFPYHLYSSDNFEELCLQTVGDIFIVDNNFVLGRTDKSLFIVTHWQSNGEISGKTKNREYTVANLQKFCQLLLLEPEKISKKKDAIINITCGNEQLPLLKAINQLGYICIGVDINIRAVGFGLCQEQVVVSSHDASAVIEKLRLLQNKYNFVAVITKSSGKSSYTTARVANEFNLPGASLELLQALTNKSEQNNLFAKIGFKVLPLVTVNLKDNLQAKNLLYPIVVRPDNNLGGKRLVEKIENHDLLLDYLHKYSNNGKVHFACTSYLKGNDIGVIVIFTGNEFKIVGVIDELNIFRENGKILNIGHFYPSENYFSEIITKYLQQFCNYFSPIYGLGQFSFRVTPTGESYFIELHFDLGGEFIIDKLLQLGLGMNLIPLFIKYYCNSQTKEKFTPKQSILLSNNFANIPTPSLLKQQKKIEVVPLAQAHNFSEFSKISVTVYDGENLSLQQLKECYRG